MEDISLETQELITKASAVYKEHFGATTCFERAIFFSWWCGINDCGFCFMSALPKDKTAKETAIRHESSILAETWLCKKMGWEFGFFSGGVNAFNADKVEDMLKKINVVYGEPVWINIGAVPKRVLERYAPYVCGVVGSIETVNPEVHKKACPSKPMLPYFRMFEAALAMGKKTAMTFIVGLGETREDLPLLLETIEKYNISKIHVYGLVPHEGTAYENAQAPSADEQAWWIAQIRIAFPTLDIQCGIWSDRVERTHVLLEAGSNSVSKLPVFRKFATPLAHQLEEEARLAKRTFEGSLTVLPELDLDELDAFGFDETLTAAIKKKAQQYIKIMQKNVRKHTPVSIRT